MNIKSCPECGGRMVKSKSGKTWECIDPDCGLTLPVPPHAPGTPPDLTAIIGPERRAWLGKQPGGVSAALRLIIDAAMQDEK